MKRVSLRILSTLVVFGLMMILMACGGSNAPAPTATKLPPTSVPTQTPTATEAPPTPTETLEPSPTSSPTPEPLIFTLDELMAGAGLPASEFESCKVGQLALQCPVGWAQELESDEHIIFASENVLLDGFSPGDSGGKLEIHLFDSFDLEVAAPEDVLQEYVETAFPGGLPKDKIMDGPSSFSLGEADGAAVVFSGDQKEPDLVVVMLALQKYGRVATIGISVSADIAAETLPMIVQGVAELDFDISPHTFAMLPAGSTYSVLGTVNGEGIPSLLFSNSNQAVFIAVEPLEKVDVVLELIDMNSGKVLVSSDREKNEYLYFEIKDAGQYGYRVNSKGLVPFVTTVIATEGVTIAADALENTFSCRLGPLTNLTYLAMPNQGEKIFLKFQAGDEKQQLVGEIYTLTDLSNPLTVVTGTDTEGYMFKPPVADWHLVAVRDENGVTGPCMVTINYEAE